MRKLILTAGVAALAMAIPAAAKPGGGNGGGHGNGGGQAQGEHGGGGGQPQFQRGGHGGGHGFAVQQQRGGAGGGGPAYQMERRGGGGGQAFAQQGGGGGHAQKAEHRGGGNTARFANFQSERGHVGGSARQMEKRGGGQRQARMEDRGGGNGHMRIDNRGGGQRFAAEQHGRGGGHRQRMAMNGGNLQNGGEFRGKNRDFAQGRGAQALVNGGYDPEFVQRVRGADFYNPDNFDRVYNTTMFVNRGLPAAYVGGCPPGLAKKSPACVPPGLARAQFVGRALPDVYASNYIPDDLRYIYGDTPDYYYRYGDGYVYRVNRADNLVAALLPLIGGGYGVGQPFPNMADPYYSVPNYYQSFYPDSPYDFYRYDNGYVYQIDAGSGLIEDVIPLLDRGYGVGQMMPAGYSYYNVPYQYRDVYYDTPDYYYRYAPGAIYQVDRGTQMITSIASLLTGGLAVGQPLPPAYSAYNVPMAYRPMYYDTPDSWYRYSDGYIYQVDPTTQLITAIVRAIV